MKRVQLILLMVLVFVSEAYSVECLKTIKFKKDSFLNDLNKRCIISLSYNELYDTDKNEAKIYLLDKDYFKYSIYDNYYTTKKRICYGIMGLFSRLCRKRSTKEKERYLVENKDKIDLMNKRQKEKNGKFK